MIYDVTIRLDSVQYVFSSTSLFVRFGIIFCQQNSQEHHIIIPKIVISFVVKIVYISGCLSHVTDEMG